ncbi:MAG: GntR family transcriptional regulator [Acidobacteriota bacterium]
MKFQIEENSAVPVIRQIQEQIKLSIAMGMLKRGDILPSIRQIERDTGINRGQIHRAFQCLYSSGLLSHAQGNRTMVSVSAAAPDSVNKKCKAFSDDVIERIRRIGISPIAFARYLGSHARENERRSPFIAYVDSDKDTAIQRAQQLSKLWHASITGLSVEEFKSGPAGRNPIRKILVNHLSFDSIRRVIQARQIDIIPIEIRYTEQTIRDLGKMRASSMLVLLPDHAASSARFIVDQLHKWIRSKDVINFLDGGQGKI